MVSYSHCRAVFTGLFAETVRGAHLLGSCGRIDAEYEPVFGLHGLDVDRGADDADRAVFGHCLPLGDAHRIEVGVGGDVLAVGDVDVESVGDAVALHVDHLPFVDGRDARSLGTRDLGHVVAVAFHAPALDGKVQVRRARGERGSRLVALGEFLQFGDGRVELLLLPLLFAQYGLFARRHALQYVQPGLALVGDAAHTIHPLAGQGVNLGYRDVDALIDVLVNARSYGEAWASYPVLKRYQMRRMADNFMMQSGMDLFYAGFSNNLPPLRFVRNLGLMAAERAGVLKRKALKYALGL